MTGARHWRIGRRAKNCTDEAATQESRPKPSSAPSQCLEFGPRRRGFQRMEEEAFKEWRNTD
jgi:hypothetical protein